MQKVKTFASGRAQKIKELNDRTIRMNKTTGSHLVGNIVTYALLIALSIIFLVPYIYMFLGSLMSATDIADISVKWIPRAPMLDNYRNAVMVLDYWKRLLFSVFITGMCVVGQVVVSAFVGYGLGRIKFKLNGLLFVLVIFSMIIPPQTIIVCQYLMYAQFGVVHTWVPMVLPCFFGLGLNGGLFVFLFRQFFRAAPRELENAAMIDGTGFFGAFFRVMLPCASSQILVVSILSMIWQWNNYFEPSVYINNQDSYTLTMMLQSAVYYEAVAGSLSFTSGLQLAATVLCALPIIIVFFILQKRFIKGIETTGLAN